MKINLGQLVASRDALQRLIASKLPIGIAWDLKLLVSKTNPELSIYEKMRNELVMKYGEPIENNKNKYLLKPENGEVFLKELQEIEAKEIEIETPVIPIAELKKHPIDIMPGDLLILDWLIK